MQTIQVKLADRSYPIYIGSDLLENTELLQRHIKGNQALIVTNDTLAPLYLSKVSHALRGLHCDTLILPDGEQYKTQETVNQIFDMLLKKRHDRNTTLLALGGGVIGDMTGFAAACYRRGVNFLQLPTTLLAQVDSSIGGKTGVNHLLGKNMIGAFYQPQSVIIDLATLATLPDREFRAGLAEVVKYGLIWDESFFEWLEQNIEAVLKRDLTALTHIITHSCAIKAEIVALDERELGLRALLNFGHTFGHVIETATDYKLWLHGEAVGLGMLIASQLSHAMNLITANELDRINVLLNKIKLPNKLPATISVEQMLSLMSLDKKVLDQKLRLILLEKIGKSKVTSDFDNQQVELAVRKFKLD